MRPSATISLAVLEAWPALSMTWQAHPSRDDISHAFQNLLDLLNESNQALYLLVDLRQNLTMPLSETINNALLGAYVHPQLRACLVLGGHSQARAVGNILSRITRQNKIIWFKDEAEIEAFLEDKIAITTK